MNSYVKIIFMKRRTEPPNKNNQNQIFTGVTTNDNHSPGPVIWEVSPYLSPER